MLVRLAQDECIIGKVPAEETENFPALFEQWDTNEDGNITWEEFREGLNRWNWRMVERELLDEIINDFFSKAYKYKMQGKEAESKEMTTKALRLQGSLTKTKPIETTKKVESNERKRGDEFTRHVHRRPEGVTPDDVIGGPDQMLNKTKTLKFAV